MNSTGFWAATRNAILKVVAFWVLLVAAYLALGRQFFPYIDRLEPEIELWLSNQLGTSVEIGQIKGEWVRFNPVLHLTDVKLGDDLSLTKMSLAPGIFESISRGGLSFIRFELVDFSAELVQSLNGWQMTGLSPDEPGQAAIDLQFVLQLLRRQEEVQFTNAQLKIIPRDLPAFDLTLNDGRLSGYREENGLIADATLKANGVNIPIELQVETTQNAQGQNRVYFRHGEIDVSPWLQGISQAISKAEVSGEYWVNLSGENWQNATVRLTTSSTVFEGEFDQVTLGNASVEAYFEYKANGFESWINLLEYELNAQAFGSSQAKLSHRADRVKLQWDSVPAEIVGHWFALSDPGEFWRSISPSGFLEQGVMTFTQGKKGSLRVTSDVSDLSIQAYKSVPGLNRMSGVAKMQGTSGELLLSANSTDFRLPNLYAQTFNAEVPSTTLRWDIHPEFGLFAQGVGELVLTPSNLKSSVSESLPLNLNWKATAPTLEQKRSGRDSTLELNMSGARLDRDWSMLLTNNALVSPNVSSLIDSRLESGEFNNFKLNYLTSTDFSKETKQQFFINSNFENVQTGFLDNWYSLQNLQGTLQLTNPGLKISVDHGQYPGFEIRDGRAELDYQSLVMDIHFEAASTTQDSLSFLKTGPLRPLYGDQLDNWFGKGQAKIDATFAVPLLEPGSFNANVIASLSNSEVIIDDIAMGFDEVNGDIIFNTQTGLSSNNLIADHLGLPQRLSVRSSLDPDNTVIDIQAQGKTSISYWGRRFDDAFLTSQNVEIEHITEVTVSNANVNIRSKSDLKGLLLELPDPYFKAATDAKKFELNINMDSREWMQIEASFDDSLVSYFELDQANEIKRGTVAVNRPLNVRSENGVYFDISVGAVDGDDWWQAIQDLREMYVNQALPNTQKPSFESLIREIDIEAAAIDYLSQPWTNANATLFRNEDAWLVAFDVEEGQGQVLIPHNDEPIFTELQWVSVTTGEEDIDFDKVVDPLLNYAPSDVPNMQIQINKLIWNQRDMGSWRTELSQKDGSLFANNIIGDMSGAELRGQLTWSKNDSKHKTGFVGDITLGNVADVLDTWEYAPVLLSRDGSVSVDAFWQGSPAHFDFKRLQGEIDLRLNKGSILNVDEYEGVKLIGLLNFTRVIQRIALDFSDLLQSGITFDSIDGELLFDRGFARVGEKLVIDGSATKFRFSGDADLLSDELDIDMVLTVPLSSTFPLVALLAGVSPQAAAAIYVTERVFNNELERLSSARMHITGSFEEPVTKFYRVFDNTLGDDPTVTDRIREVVPEGVSSP